jgi:hypothetical protein
MRAEPEAWRAAAAGFCVLLTARAPVSARPLPAHVGARYSELAGRN